MLPEQTTVGRIELLSTKRVIVSPVVQLPLNVGEELLVVLSVLDEPVSELASKSGADGAIGAVVSTVITKGDGAVVFPAGSVEVIVKF